MLSRYFSRFFGRAISVNPEEITFFATLMAIFFETLLISDRDGYNWPLESSSSETRLDKVCAALRKRSSEIILELLVNF